jgi:hypothetical protein
VRAKTDEELERDIASDPEARDVPRAMLLRRAERSVPVTVIGTV